MMRPMFALQIVDGGCWRDSVMVGPFASVDSAAAYVRREFPGMPEDPDGLGEDDVWGQGDTLVQLVRMQRPRRRAVAS